MGHNMYSFQVNYSKRFTSGLLKGKLHHEYLRFCDYATAYDFARMGANGHVFKACAGNSTYTIEDITTTELE